MIVPRSIFVLSMGLVLAACGGASATSAGGQGAAGGASQPPLGSAAPASVGSGAGAVTGHVGDKLTFAKVGGDPVVATLVKVFDPATPKDASEAPLPSGTHWVGVEVILDNETDYSGELSEINGVTSAGTSVDTNNTYQGYSHVLGDGFTGCTQTDGSEQDVQPYTHCAAFLVADGQTLAKVGVKVGGAEIDSTLVPTDQATWTVP